MWSYFLNRVTCLVKADSNSERQTGWSGGGEWGGHQRGHIKGTKLMLLKWGAGIAQWLEHRTRD